MCHFFEPRMANIFAGMGENNLRLAANSANAAFCAAYRSPAALLRSPNRLVFLAHSLVKLSANFCWPVRR